MPAFHARCKANKITGLLETSPWFLWLFLPLCSLFPLPPKPTARHYTKLVFTLALSLKDNCPLCSDFMEELLCFGQEQPGGATAHFRASSSSSPRRGRPPPAGRSRGPWAPPALPPRQGWPGARLPPSPALLADVPARFTGSWGRYEGCQEFVLNCSAEQRQTTFILKLKFPSFI